MGFLRVRRLIGQKNPSLISFYENISYNKELSAILLGFDKQKVSNEQMLKDIKV